MSTSKRSLLVPAFALLFALSADALAAKRKKAPEESGPQVTFMGFRSGGNGRSTIFVELTQSLPVEMSEAQGSVVFSLKGGKVLNKTNRYPLLTNEFGSPVVSAQLVQAKEGVNLVVKLRDDVTPSHRMSDVRDGAVLEVEFQQGR